MEYNFKKIVGLCVDKVAAMVFNPNFELSPTLSDTKLTYLSEMIKHPVKSFQSHDNEESTKFDKEFEHALVIAEAMQRVSRNSVLLDSVQAT